MFDASEFRRWQYALSVPGALVLVLSLAYVGLSYRPLHADASEVFVPMAVSLGLIAFSLRRARDYETEQLERIATWSWRGLLVGALVGGWWVVVHLTANLPVAGLSDQILTLLSFGSGAGVAVGQHESARPTADRPREQSRVVTETVWTGRADKETITVAVGEALADVEGVEPHRLNFTLYEHVNPDAFESLADHDGSPWQLLFHVEKYEVRVSSYGTVTVLERDGAATTAS